MTFLLASGPGLRGNREERGAGDSRTPWRALPTLPPSAEGLQGPIFSHEGPTWSQPVWLCFPSKGLEKMSAWAQVLPHLYPLPALSC